MMNMRSSEGHLPSLGNSSRKKLLKMETIIADVVKRQRYNNHEQYDEKPIHLAAERITIPRFLLFFLYFACLIAINELRASFFYSQKTTKKLEEVLLNEFRTNSGAYESINSELTAFKDIKEFNDALNWIRTNIIDSVYGGAAIFDHGDPQNPTAAVYTLITPIRILQQRARVIGMSDNQLFPNIWDSGETDSDTNIYGSKYPAFAYNTIENGFNLTLPTFYMTQSEVETIFENAIDNGYVDNQTSKLNIDFAVYCGLTNIVSYFKAEFGFSPTGRIEKKSTSLTGLVVTMYQGADGRTLLALQCVFSLLFLYYFFLEFAKVYNRIRNASFMAISLKDKDLNILEKAARVRDRVRYILKGFLDHISDPWCFLDLVSLTCSAYSIGAWIQIYVLDEPTSSISALGLKEGLLSRSQLNSEKEAIIYGLNRTVESLFKTISTNNLMTAINCLILVLKSLKYITKLSKSIGDVVRIGNNNIARLAPFLLLLFVVLSAFVLVCQYFYGQDLEEFSTFFGTLCYLVSCLHFNSSQVENMFKVDFGFTVVFQLVFIFMVNFILSSQFIIYVTHEYINFFKEKFKSRKKKLENEKFDFRPHFLWRITHEFKKKLQFIIYKRMSKDKYEALKKLESEEKSEQKQLILFQNFDFNLDISHKDKESEQTVTFHPEKVMKKIRARKKLEIVKEVWKIIGLIILGVCYYVIIIEHQKISDARSIIDSIKRRVHQRSVGNQTLFPVKLDNLRGIDEMAQWLTTLFPKFATHMNFTYRDYNKTYHGNFLNRRNLLITNKYRLSLRKAMMHSNELEVYNTVSSEVYATEFTPEGQVYSSEYTIPLISGGNSYNYTASKGYANAGGYIFTEEAESFENLMSRISKDGFFSAYFNSAVLDFPLYQLESKSCVYVAFVFVIDDAGNIFVKTKTNFISLNYYQTPYQNFIFFAEIVVIIGFILKAIFLFRKIRFKKRCYNNWYNFNILNFPSLMKKYREKKKPESLRKYLYVFDFEEVSDLVYLLIGAACIILWTVYVTGLRRINNLVEDFLSNDVPIDNDLFINRLTTASEIFTCLKIIEPLIFVVITAKIIYSYSSFRLFSFLIKTIKRTVKTMPPLAIVFVIILLGFALFLHVFKGTTSSDLSNMTSSMLLLLQNLYKYRTELNYLLTGDSKYEMTLLYYFPLVFLLHYMFINMFLAMMFAEYKAIKEKQHRIEQPAEKLTFKDFYKTTILLLTCFKKKANNVKEVNFSQQTTSKANLRRAFEKFESSVEMANSVKDSKTLTLKCAQDLVDEHDFRKCLKKKAKDMTRIDLGNLTLSFGEEKQVDYETKLAKYKARLGYWEYMRVGREKMLRLAKNFNQSSEELERQIEANNNKKKPEEAEAQPKLEKYILLLESQLEKNFTEVQKMKKIVEKYFESTKV